MSSEPATSSSEPYKLADGGDDEDFKIEEVPSAVEGTCSILKTSPSVDLLDAVIAQGRHGRWAFPLALLSSEAPLFAL